MGAVSPRSGAPLGASGRRILATSPASCNAGLAMKGRRWREWWGERGERWLGLGLVAASALWVLWPFHTTHWYDNDEVDRYPARLEVFFDHVSWANPYPRWIPELAGGTGYPLFDFFNPGFIFVGLPFRALGLSPTDACKAAILVLLLVGGFYARALAIRLLPSESRHREVVGAFAGFFYLTAPYTLSNLYLRGDLAELGAMMLFPLVLFHAAAFLERGGWLDGLMLALGWGLLIPMHAFSALLFTLVFSALHLAILLRGHATLLQVGRSVVPAILGAGLSGFYWVPVLKEMGSVSIHGFFTMEQFEVFALPAMGLLDDAIDGPMGDRLFTYGWLLPLLGLLGWGVRRRARTAHATWLGVLLGSAVVAAFLSTRAAGPIYESVPPLAMIVFPWRWLGIGSLCLALLAGRVALVGDRWTHWALLLALGVLVAWPSVVIPKPTWLEPGTFDYAARAENEYVLFDYGEYYPAGSRPSVRPPRHATGSRGCVVGPLERGPARELPRMSVRVEAAQPCAVTFPHFRWIAFEGRVDGSPAPTRADPRGYAVVDVEPGTHDVAITYVRTGPQRLGGWLTLGSLLLWLGLVSWRSARLLHGRRFRGNPPGR